MKCKKWQRAIHRLLDGETTAEQEKEIRAHIDQCPECSAYYRDMDVICRSLREEDREPPSGFRSAWRKSLNTRRAAKRKTRPGALIPAAACMVVAVFVVSTAVSNPQVFGLGGAQVRSEQAELSPSPGSVSDSGTGADTGTIVFGDTVGGTQKSAVPVPQPVTAVFSETTAVGADDEAAGIVAQGDLGESPAPLDAEKAENTADETAVEEAVALSEAPFELNLHEQNAALEVHRVAEHSGKIELHDGTGCFLMEGSEADLRAALGAHSAELPAETRKVLVCWDVESSGETPEVGPAASIAP